MAPVGPSCAVASGSAPDGAPPTLAYQPQHAWSDGDFDVWCNIGAPTISKRVTRERISMYLAIHPNTQIRVLRIVSSAEVIEAAEFLPNDQTSEAAKPVSDDPHAASIFDLHRKRQGLS